LTGRELESPIEATPQQLRAAPLQLQATPHPLPGAAQQPRADAQPPPTAAPNPPAQATPVKKLELPTNMQPAAPAVEEPPGAQRAAKPKVQVVRLQLAKVVEPTNQAGSEATVNSEASLLDGMIARVLADAQQTTSNEQLLTPLLRAFSEELKLPRLIALRATQSRRELVAVGGVGDDIEGISKELRIPLSSSRAASDPFSLCYHARRDFLIDDVFSPKLSSSLPQRYFEVIGSTCLGLLHCGTPSTQTLVLLIDLEPPHQLPTQQQLERFARVRLALSKAAPAATL
jgi:hypothetical protein